MTLVGGIKKYGSLTIADFVRYIVQYINKNTQVGINRRAYSSFRYVFTVVVVFSAVMIRVNVD